MKYIESIKNILNHVDQTVVGRTESLIRAANTAVSRFRAASQPLPADDESEQTSAFMLLQTACSLVNQASKALALANDKRPETTQLTVGMLITALTEFKEDPNHIFKTEMSPTEEQIDPKVEKTIVAPTSSN